MSAVARPLSLVEITAAVVCLHCWFYILETDRNLVSVKALKLVTFLVSVTVIIVKHGFGLLSVTAETTTRFRREPKLSLLAIC